MRLVYDRRQRPCTGTLESCNSLTLSDDKDGKLTDGKLLGTFRGEEKSFDGCTDPGLTFDLLPEERFQHGQVLVVMYNPDGLGIERDVELFGDEDPG